MPLLEYRVTRPIILNKWATASIITGGILWVIIITLINTVAVGYELVSVSSTNFNNTARNWYEKVVSANSIVPPSWNCLYSVIKVNEGFSFLINCITEVVFSSPGIVPYNLQAYNDVSQSGPVDGLAYSNAALSSCAIVTTRIIQFGSDTVQDSV